MAGPVLDLSRLVTAGQVADAIGALEAVVATRDDLGAMAAVIEGALPDLVRQTGVTKCEVPRRWTFVIERDREGLIESIVATAGEA